MKAAKCATTVLIAVILVGVWASPALAADADRLYGIHWWGYTQGQAVDQAPRTMLDAPTYSAWDTETVLTNSSAEWAASYFTGLYQTLYSWNVTMITRVDYNWTECVPAPSDSNYANWPSTVVNNAVNVLYNQCHIWIVGNEPNLLMAPGSNWPNRQIPPADYAQIYRNVRTAILNNANVGAPGLHIVLVAGPSPGAVGGDRWMAGTDYLDQVLANIPANEVDGIAVHAYAGDINTFRSDYQSQLQVIDNRGLSDRAAWITEFNRWTDTGNCNDEATSAQFIRDSFADVNTWNNTAGNHDIVGMTWYVYDSNQQAGGAWNNYAIEYWKGVCYGYGNNNDMYTAFEQTVDQRYLAGQWWGGGTQAPGGSNIALNAVTYLECGHNEAGQYGLAAHDGSTATKWCCLHNGISTAGDHWLVYDLGSVATVTGYVVKHASMGGEPTYLNTKSFYIESATSLQGPWRYEFYVDNGTTVASNTLKYGTARSLRYVRIRVTKANPVDWAVRIPEFEVWGTAGTAQAIKFEAEDYDSGYVAAEGTDYHDTDSQNQGGQYRSQGVDIENCYEGGWDVGWIAAGEWLKYRLKGGGTFQTYIRYAGTSNGTCHIEVDGVNKTGSISLPSTGSYQTWVTKQGPQFTIASGNHVVKFVMDSSGFNVNHFTLDPNIATQVTNLALNSVTYLECGHNEAGQYGLAAHDGSTGTKWCCFHNGMWTPGDHWLAYDLGATATVTGYVVKHASMGGEPTYLNTKTFYIESANSLRGPWTQEFYVDNATPVESNTLTYGTAKSLRYIRLRVTKPNPSADWAVRIPEFEVRGYAALPQAVKFEAEDYDSGYVAAEGTDYHDTDSQNQGGQYRSQGVDIENCPEGGWHVGYIYNTEWLKYRLKGGGTYKLDIRYAANANAGCYLEVDGVNKTWAINLPSTGGYQNWTTKNGPTFTLPSGNHVVKFRMTSANYNLNYFVLTPR